MASTTRPHLPDRVEQGDKIEIEGQFPDPLTLRLLSPPSFEMVGIYHDRILGAVDGDTWMFAAVIEDTREVVYVLGGDRNAHLAFSEDAARVGATNILPLGDVSVV